jgi:hypothetical protein
MWPKILDAFCSLCNLDFTVFVLLSLGPYGINILLKGWLIKC